MKSSTTYWTAWTLTAALIAVLTFNPAYLIILFLSVAVNARRSQIPVLQIVRLGIFFSIPLLLVNTLLVHKGTQIIFEIPQHVKIISQEIPLLILAGPVTLESIGAGLIFALLLVNMLLIFTVFNKNTTPESIISILPKAFGNSALLIALSLKFVPTLTRDARSISDAQKSRGQGKQGIGNIRGLASLFIPLLVNSLERSYSLAEAIESRAYTASRTSYRQERIKGMAVVRMLLFAILIILFTFLKISSRLDYWAPQAIQVLDSFPPFNLLIAFSILLLAIPPLK